MKFRKTEVAEDDFVTIDLTSLVDVLFVLVLFFVVTTTFSSYSDIGVNLPSVKSAPQPSTVKDAEINISEAGVIEISGHKLANNKEIPELIHRTDRPNSAVPVLIRADKKVAHGVVVGVLDELKRGGFEQVAIATEATDVAN